MIKLLPYDIDEVVVITNGIFHDYCIERTVIVLKSFEVNELLEEWAEIFNCHDGEVNEPNPNAISFIDYLKCEGYVEDYPARNLHLGDNYDLELSAVTMNK